jgi:hypothetical protein
MTVLAGSETRDSPSTEERLRLIRDLRLKAATFGGGWMVPCA